MHLFIQLVICVAVASSYIEATSEKLDKGFDRWRRSDIPGSQSAPPTVPVTPELCRKDILLILDMSMSIGNTNFGKMKTFLKSFINNERLDVQESGTQLAMIIFSDDKPTKTKVMFKFGQKTTQSELVTFIDNMNYNQLMGKRTYTGVALELAETKIFKTTSPANARSTIPDVIVLITDGKPNGRADFDRPGSSRIIKDETDYTKEAATRLKNKGVLIVSILVGDEKSRSSDAVTARQVLRDVASQPSLMFTVQITSIQTIMDQLLDASCNSIQEGDCQCVASAGNPVAPKYLTHDQTEARVLWTEPTVTCQDNQTPTPISKIVTPTGITSPHSFDVGQHTIKYTHIFRGGVQLVCTVVIDVKNIPCGGREYAPATQKCCCGKVWDIQPNHKCCGKNYFDRSTKKCCGTPYYNVVPKTNVCPGA